MAPHPWGPLPPLAVLASAAGGSSEPGTRTACLESPATSLSNSSFPSNRLLLEVQGLAFPHGGGRARAAAARGHRARRGAGALARGRRRGPRRLVLRGDRPVPVPGRGLPVRGLVHDGGAPDPRLGGAGRPEPPAPRRAREAGRPQPPCRHLRAFVRARRVVLRVGGLGPAGARDSREVIESRFGSARPWSLGIEEELFLVDAETLETVPAFSRVVGEPTERLKPEVFECLVEIATPVVEDADGVLPELRRLR